VLKVGSNVYVAIGYGLANSVMIEGEDGVVIIDTLESCEVARWVPGIAIPCREVRAAFEQITSKPVVAIILTHFHADHAYGTAGPLGLYRVAIALWVKLLLARVPGGPGQGPGANIRPRVLRSLLQPGGQHPVSPGYWSLPASH
jgi:glyoxylase-like metal-dependent hydrolase (beta-lactamase superfamily II)